MKPLSVLFLDIDGVLNNLEWERLTDRRFRRPNIDPVNVRHFNDLCVKVQPHIILSSAWRMEKTPAQIAAEMVKRGFRYPRRIAGQTPELPGRPRGEEIMEWVAVAPRELVDLPMLVLDDRNDMGVVRPFLLQTDPEHGLTAADVERAKRLYDLQTGEVRRSWSMTTPAW